MCHSQWITEVIRLPSYHCCSRSNVVRALQWIQDESCSDVFIIGVNVVRLWPFVRVGVPVFGISLDWDVKHIVRVVLINVPTCKDKVCVVKTNLQSIVEVINSLHHLWIS